MNGAMICDVLFTRLPRLASLGLLSLVLTTAVASAQYCTPDQCDECNLCRCSQNCCHELPELWLINTRCAPRCKNLDYGFDCITFKRYDRECCRWVTESLESFLAQEATMPTLFYSHGNSLNHKNAMKSCWMVYKKMRCCPGTKRLVFWSWPAERVFKTKGLRVRKMIAKNLRIKYVYAEYQGYYMAKLVNQMSLSQRVMMSGHSYGAITAAAALHYIGGGCLRGLTLEGGAPVERPNLRAGIISGAFDHDMLIPGHRYGQAFVAGEKIFVTRNINDRTLKKWPDTSLRGRRAIGVLGVNANYLGEHRNKLCQLTMSSDVGTSHYLKPHLKSVRFVAALCCLSFPACQQSPLAAAESAAEPEILTELELPAETVCNEQLVAEAKSIFDNNFFDFSEDSADDPSEFDNLSMFAASDLTPLDASDVFGSELLPFSKSSYAKSQGKENLNVETLDVEDINPGNINAFVNPEWSSFQSIDNRNAVPVILDAIEAKPSELKQAIVKFQQAGHSGSGQLSLGYRIGLGLAIVLTGKFYVLLSKRVSPS